MRRSRKYDSKHRSGRAEQKRTACWDGDSAGRPGAGRRDHKAQKSAILKKEKALSPQKIGDKGRTVCVVERRKVLFQQRVDGLAVRLGQRQAQHLGKGGPLVYDGHGIQHHALAEGGAHA